MHFGVVVLLPAGESDIDAAVERALEPHWSARQTSPRKEYVSRAQRRALAAVYHIGWLRGWSSRSFARALEARAGHACGVDEGGLWWTTTANPDGRWDYWLIDNPQEHVRPVSAVPVEWTPAAVLTPDGHWHEFDNRRDLPAAESDRRTAQAHALIHQYPEHIAALVHCHG